MNFVSTSVLRGDITYIPCNALITGINSSGYWYGGIDKAIQRKAGSYFHDQMANFRPWTNLKAVTVFSNYFFSFKSVIFVIDDLETPLREVVFSGLKEANRNKFETVNIPVMRSGVVFGIVEKTKQEVADQIQKGLEDFYGTIHNPFVKQVNLVVYNDEEMATLLELGPPADWDKPKGRKLRLE